MSGIFDALGDIFKEMTEQVQITKRNPEGSLMKGTLVQHMEEPGIFGVVLDSYETENKDIYDQKLIYYNILWASSNQSNSRNLFSYGETSLEPETELVAWHGFLLNK